MSHAACGDYVATLDATGAMCGDVGGLRGDAPSLHSPSLHSPSLHSPSLHSPSLHSPSLHSHAAPSMNPESRRKHHRIPRIVSDDSRHTYRRISKGAQARIPGELKGGCGGRAREGRGPSPRPIPPRRGLGWASPAAEWVRRGARIAKRCGR